ncbi:MAG: type II secretion system F family protein [Candidatus Omnitrophota bacterium]
MSVFRSNVIMFVRRGLMPFYIYKARDPAGRSVKGIMDAVNKQALIAELHEKGCMTTFVAKAPVAGIAGSILDKFQWIGPTEMLMFYFQLSNLINAGITILASLNTLSRQIENKILKEAVDTVVRQVESGRRLSEAFAMYPGIFSKLFVNMINSGEKSGKLDVVLKRYALFFEQQHDIKEKIQGALFYPLILLCAGVAVTLFVVTFIMPQFSEIYLRAGLKLPVPTLIVYKTGMALKSYWYLFAASFVGFLAALRYYVRTPGGKFLRDRLKLRMIIIGPLYREVYISRFTRTLATLLGSGLSILEALNLSKEVIENEIMVRAVAQMRKSVEKGDRMAQSMKISGEFPANVVQMVAAGEESGNLAEMLNKIADFYDISVGYTIKKLTTLIEPLFLVVMGSMVGMIMASMLMPIFDMVKTLKR